MRMDDGSENATIEFNDNARQDADIARTFPTAALHDAPPSATSPDTGAPKTPPLAHILTATKRSDRHTLTLRDVVSLFHRAGLPRSPRSIQRYCSKGDLDAFHDPDERIYYITAESVENLISHISEVNQRHAGAPLFGQPPPAALHDAPPSATSPDTGAPKTEEQRDSRKHDATEERIKQLEDENFHLRVDAAARAQVITELRQVIREDRTFYTKHVSKLSMLASSFKSRLLQLGAPKEELDAVEDAETSELDDSTPSRAFSSDLKE